MALSRDLGDVGASIGVGAVFAGAAIGALLLVHVGLIAPLARAGALVLFGTLTCTRHPAFAASRS